MYFHKFPHWFICFVCILYFSMFVIHWFHRLVYYEALSYICVYFLYFWYPLFGVYCWIAPLIHALCFMISRGTRVAVMPACRESLAALLPEGSGAGAADEACAAILACNREPPYDHHPRAWTTSYIWKSLRFCRVLRSEMNMSVSFACVEVPVCDR